MLSKNTIKNLYSNLQFPGSYYSAHNFYSELQRKYGKNKVPKYEEILAILETIPTYQIHASYRKVQQYRHLDNVQGQGISLQVDLAFMPEIHDFKGFLIEARNGFLGHSRVDAVNQASGQFITID